METCLKQNPKKHVQILSYSYDSYFTARQTSIRSQCMPADHSLAGTAASGAHHSRTPCTKIMACDSLNAASEGSEIGSKTLPLQCAVRRKQYAVHRSDVTTSCHIETCSSASTIASASCSGAGRLSLSRRSGCSARPIAVPQHMGVSSRAHGRSGQHASASQW